MITIISPNNIVIILKYLSINFLAVLPNILIIPVNIKKRAPLDIKEAIIKVMRFKCIPPDERVISL